MLKRIFLNKYFLIFLFVHILLLNINFAEWGDSYRILRASEHIRNFSYPQDEKRPPLYSLILAFRPSSIDQILWGRIVMFGVSLVSFALFFLFLDQIKFDDKKRATALWLFTFNPVLLYWSIRIYADVFLMMLALLVFYLMEKWRGNYSNSKLILIGVFLGFSILTRFEGYLLAVAVGLGYFLQQVSNKKLRTSAETLKGVFVLALSTVVVVLPWFIIRNPFTSTYFEEPQRRIFDQNTAAIYVASLLFLFGFTSAFIFLYRSRYHIKDFFKFHKAILIFIIFELVLCLIWPAALPRLFVQVIPYLIIILAYSSVDFFQIEDHSKKVYVNVTILLSLFAIYLITQYFYKLQFLVLIKSSFFILLVVQLINMVSIMIKNQRIFMFSMFISTLIWSIATIYLHKDLYRGVVEANKYISKNLTGVVAYNDVSSVSDWYLNQRFEIDDVSGIYLNMDAKDGRTYDTFYSKGVDYVLITNEHNTDMEFDPDEISYLEQITEFRYTIRGKEFFSKVLEFER